jgi:methylmalonyl-CoA mutase
MVKAIESGIPKLRIEEAAARTQARIDSGEQVVVGVNRYINPRAAEIEVLKVNNDAVRREQLDKLGRLRAGRDGAAVDATLADLMRIASGTGNLLAACVAAARAGATVGEMSAAMERFFGRHVAEVQQLSGVYRRTIGDADFRVEQVAAMTAAFAENAGRRPKILVAKIGQDGHDRGQKIIASAFGDFGFEVEVGPLFATPEEAACNAVEADVHVLGISTLAAGHLTLVPAVSDALATLGRTDIMVVAGGVIPEADRAALDAVGVSLVFSPGTPVAEAALRILEQLNRRLGYVQKDAAE